MMRKILFFFFLGTCLLAQAQNLVPNGSFEDTINCPANYDALHYDCAHWYKSIQIPGNDMFENPSPDWWHPCGANDLLTPPDVAFGYQAPFDGDAFAGVITYSASNSNYREIVGVKLIEPLVVGQTYVVSFRLNRAHREVQALASSKFGCLFSTDSVFSTSEELIDNYSHFSVDSIITDTTNWQLYEFEFSADSAFTHLHMGNFYDDMGTDTTTHGNGYPLQSYYFLDDVKVSSLLSSFSKENINSRIEIYPNPSSNHLFISLRNNDNLSKFQIYNVSGQKLKEGRIESMNDAIEIKSLLKGLYIISLIDEEKKRYSKTFLKQ